MAQVVEFETRIPNTSVEAWETQARFVLVDGTVRVIAASDETTQSELDALFEDIVHATRLRPGDGADFLDAISHFSDKTNWARMTDVFEMDDAAALSATSCVAVDEDFDDEPLLELTGHIEPTITELRGLPV